MVWGTEISLWILLGVASYCDLRTGKIPNRLTFSFILTGILFQMFFMGTHGLSRSGLAVGAAFAIYFPLFAMRAVAAGDVKLLMGVAAWTNVQLAVQIGLLSILVGAAVGLFFMVTSRGGFVALASIKQHWTLSNRPAAGQQPLDGTRIAFAPALFCAYLLTKIGGYYGWL